MQTMTRREINGEEYLDIGECAEYLRYSRTTIGVVLKRYEKQVGHKVRIPDGRHIYVSMSDLEKMLIQFRPMTAKERGLI